MYKISLDVFEGPFDLLLFFIERDELDIYDIPISKVTKDFLEYTRELEGVNIDLASEFILFASTLMRIKAKMLLPRKELDEEGNEIDPREELVKHLLEYKKYKETLATFEELESKYLPLEKRGNVMKELRGISQEKLTDFEMQHLDMYKLFKVYNRLMQRYQEMKDRPVHQIRPYPYTINEQKAKLLTLLSLKSRMSFVEVVNYEPNKVAVIFNFLSILELCQVKKVQIQLGSGYNQFFIALL